MRKKFQINMRVRIKNKMFWLAIIPAVLILVQAIGALFGVEISIVAKQEQLTAIVEAVFAILAVLGVVNDPTTEGLSDSNNAMLYDEPKER